MTRIATTPEPPYYAVIAPAVLSSDVSGYPQLAQHLIETAPSIDGFLGIETCFQGNFVIAVSYWRSLEAIEAWRNHPKHLHAKAAAKARWFDQYLTRIAKVEKVY